MCTCFGHPYPKLALLQLLLRRESFSIATIVKFYTTSGIVYFSLLEFLQREGTKKLCGNVSASLILHCVRQLSIYLEISEDIKRRENDLV